ncbi:MAG: thioredoxin family protein [Bacteroidales bacterium]|jgi:small redox-active disulfide protein 2|nr:thioredoxin family protein [Bacteroidales bacterium]MDD2687519.1 thioredoxin family protein [Bacteroidales bacterium]MDD3329765.1 thioredoxin family protein [Bacteroidales bacterium]MDD3690624.1 thioredoxin family protein [Bacteroidales bacterium]MDD4045047.1 thioredoxin family protein [Bacteroidales bacterium]
MNIKILGTGCSKCKVLYENTEKAIAELGLEATLVKEEDIVNILKYNTLTLPALVIDEKVVSSGHILSVSQIKDVLTKK